MLVGPLPAQHAGRTFEWGASLRGARGAAVPAEAAKVSVCVCGPEGPGRFNSPPHSSPEERASPHSDWPRAERLRLN